MLQTHWRGPTGAFWLLLAALLVLSSGYGTHEPWAPDAPRFAAVARDMLASGDWLFPRVGGDLYADKPPLFFWLLAGAFWLTGSVRAGFLLPSLLAGIGTLCLLYDLTRRLWDTRTAVTAGLLLLAAPQFLLQAHTAQIDGVLCFWITLGWYGLLRCLLLGDGLRWAAVGGSACGIGVITKGVGFLPLLMLVPWYALRRRRRAGPAAVRGIGLAAAAMLLPIALWLVPLLTAAAGDPALIAYRDEILFGQTIERYLDASGHLKSPWYFFTNVIPWAWLPGCLLLPWLLPRWRAAWRAGEDRVLLPLAWMTLVLIFFMVSSGKRGVYILPALPAFCLAAAPYLDVLRRRTGVNGLAAAVLVLFAAICASAAWYAGTPHSADGFTLANGMVPHVRLAFALLAVLACGWLVAGRRRGQFPALGGFLLSVWIVIGWYVMPVIDNDRSGARIVRAAERALPPGGELGVVQPKESLLLQARGALTNFGHRRTDRRQELADAALWLAGSADRRLIAPRDVLAPCFAETGIVALGSAHRRDWSLVAPGAVSTRCARDGQPGNAIRYVAATELPSLWRWHRKVRRADSDH